MEANKLGSLWKIKVAVGGGVRITSIRGAGCDSH